MTRCSGSLAALAGVLLALAPLAAQAQPEIPDNAVDEDGDGWLGTSYDFQVRASHPRVLIDAEGFEAALARMTGPGAVSPYSEWFDLIRQSEDGGEPVDLMSLAILYKATDDTSYRDRFMERLAAGSGDPELTELLGLDIMFDEVDEGLKHAVMARVAANPDCWYWNSTVQSGAEPDEVAWGYHAAFGVARALAYAGVFALTDVELGKDPATYPFNALNYLRITSDQLADDGFFRQMENRVAGDPTFNTALPGSCGGMYDNFGYDSSEESYSINVVAPWFVLTGEDRFTGFLHDQNRAAFYQNLFYPYKVSAYESDQWCRRAGTESHTQALIWSTQTDWISQPRTDAVSLTAFLYRDPRMQFYADTGVQPELCGEPYDGLSWEMLYYDSTLPAEPPSTNPTAMYFSGPGIVGMRENWTNDAAFAVLMCGEGISRRYEDANSFLLGRKTDVVVHAGARIRFDEDNDNHHWYHIRSASKNTLKIFDPEESFDINADGTTGALHSGQRLVDSDNLGGQIFETTVSSVDGCFPTWSGPCDAGLMRSGEAFPLTELWETGDIVKFEHAPDRFTYAVGDGTAAYTRKIEYFQRELLYLRPDVFIIFDRVRTVDPSYRKVWVIHTVDEPVVDGTPVEEGSGVKVFENAAAATIASPLNVTTIDVLLPALNTVTARGGDTVLVDGLPLRPGVDIPGASISASDIPRWLELFAVGSDAEGSLLLEGDAREGAGVSETVTFDGTTRDFVDSVPTSDVTSTSLQDTTQTWVPDQWTGYLVDIRIGGSGETAVITGNDENTLFGAFTPGSSWRYTIFKVLANSYQHWTTLTRVSTTDLDLDDLTISTPHYFDTQDVTGRVLSFAPHTDGRDDGYVFRSDLGQWTLEVEAAEPSQDDVFLNVLALKDPGIARPAVSLLESEGASGALVGNAFAVFANGVDPLSAVTVTVPGEGDVMGLIADLTPGGTYAVTAVETAGGCEVTVAASSSGVLASSQGVLAFTVTDCAPCITDEDGDGYIAAACGGTDCDDASAEAHPGAAEICDDGADNDCDGLVDGLDVGDCVAPDENPDRPPDASESAEDALDGEGDGGEGDGGGDEGCGCSLAR
jgi:hypothetical protein